VLAHDVAQPLTGGEPLGIHAAREGEILGL
jgi:hypothetical protein